MSDKPKPIGWNVYIGTPEPLAFKEFIPNEPGPGVAEMVVNAFVDPMIMVVNDILDAVAMVVNAVGKALAEREEDHG